MQYSTPDKIGRVSSEVVVHNFEGRCVGEDSSRFVIRKGVLYFPPTFIRKQGDNDGEHIIHAHPVRYRGGAKSLFSSM